MLLSEAIISDNQKLLLGFHKAERGGFHNSGFAELTTESSWSLNVIYILAID